MTNLKIAFFGHFGQGNFGNDSTLLTTIAHLRRSAPEAEFTCICTGPDAVAKAYGITAVPSRAFVAESRTFRNPFARWARKLVFGVPRELNEWLESLKTLRGMDALVIPGTGILHDAYTLFSWGPYDMFRWSVSARLCRCKVLFVSVGAGPLYTRAGRYFVKAALSLADFRSYRDESTRQCLEGIGFRAGSDPVYPDLVFSLPESLIPLGRDSVGRRPVVGIGLMKYAGKYSVEAPTGAVYSAYLDVLAEFVKWLLAHEHDVRILTGDAVDRPVAEEFRLLLQNQSVPCEEERIVDEPIESGEDLLKQVAAIDVVVATRFHNVVAALLLDKPVMAISFHHKCSSLMAQMGLSEYCKDIDRLNLDIMIEQFSQLQQDAEGVKRVIAERVAACRDALDEQYALLFERMCSDGGRAP